MRKTLADSLNRRFGTDYTGDSLYLTAGAAAALMCAFRALACEGDEFVVFAPFFPEYKMFIESGAGAKCVLVPPSIEDFQIDFDAFAQRVSEHTKVVVINSPNNPSGAVYSEQTIRRLAEFLREKENEYGHPIYLISDEPYREIVYDNVTIPFVPNYYDDTIVCYSYSKSLSLPGERIGYVLVPPKAADSADLYAAVCGAGRALGYVCAPSLFQRVAARCADLTSDIAVYRTNRDLLYSGLTEMGYTCVKPEGAFYLFPRSWRRMTARSASGRRNMTCCSFPARTSALPDICESPTASRPRPSRRHCRCSKSSRKSTKFDDNADSERKRCFPLFRLPFSFKLFCFHFIV